MTTPELIELVSYPTAAQAELARVVLEEHGIDARTDGASSTTMMSIFGSAIGGVRVLVRQADAERAAAVLRATVDRSGDSDGAWQCARCHVEVDAGFDVCWSCGGDRAEVERLPADAAEHRPVPRARLDASAPAGVPPDAAAQNPYAAPQSISADASTVPDEHDTSRNQQVEARLESAWRAAILGLFFFPLSLYSMYHLVRAVALKSEFTHRGKTRFFSALAINIVAGLLWGSFLAVSMVLD